MELLGAFATPLIMCGVAVLLTVFIYVAEQCRRFRRVNAPMVTEFVYFLLAQLAVAVFWFGVVFGGTRAISAVIAHAAPEATDLASIVSATSSVAAVALALIVHAAHVLGKGRDVYWRRIDMSHAESNGTSGAGTGSAIKKWRLLARALEVFLRGPMEASIGSSMEFTRWHVSLAADLAKRLGDAGYQQLADAFKAQSSRLLTPADFGQLEARLDEAIGGTSKREADATALAVIKVILGYDGNEFLSRRRMKHFIDLRILMA